MNYVLICYLQIVYDCQVWAGRRTALILCNRGPSSANIRAYWGDIGLKPSDVVDARDVWKVNVCIEL